MTILAIILAATVVSLFVALALGRFIAIGSAADEALFASLRGYQPANNGDEGSGIGVIHEGPTT